MYDLWICRAYNGYWFAWAKSGEAPHLSPRVAESVRDIYRVIRRAGLDIGQVGIADAEMLGL